MRFSLNDWYRKWGAGHTSPITEYEHSVTDDPDDPGNTDIPVTPPDDGGTDTGGTDTGTDTGGGTGGTPGTDGTGGTTATGGTGGTDRHGTDGEPGTGDTGDTIDTAGLPVEGIYYYHPDHLGSISMVTNRNGQDAYRMDAVASRAQEAR